MFSLNTLLKVNLKIFGAKEVTCYHQSKVQYGYMTNYISLYVEALYSFLEANTKEVQVEN